jgi:DNA processing protein
VTSDIAIETLKLRCVRGVDESVMEKIYSGAGTLERALKLDMGALQEYGIKREIAENIITSNIDSQLFKSELKSLETTSGQIMCIDDHVYPGMLRETVGAPALLFARGDLSVLDKPAVAVVGSRNASRAACDFARRMSADLAEAGFNVVSGFAMGIDINAHLGAVESGQTTAVMACGVNHLFPQANSKHLGKVLENGCAVTEFLSNYHPAKHNFPRRNRIISGLSYGVIVVEASDKSGSLITARLAGEQGRDVFAVPAFPSSRNSATNSLIKNGAVLIESYYDVIEELKCQIDGLSETSKQDAGEVQFENSEQAMIFDLLARGNLSQDELSIKSGFEIESVAINLAQMELEGYVVKELDGKYSASGQA